MLLVVFWRCLGLVCEDGEVYFCLLGLFVWVFVYVRYGGELEFVFVFGGDYFVGCRDVVFVVKFWDV